MAMPPAFRMSGQVLADRYAIGRTIPGEQLLYRGTDRRGGTPVTIRMVLDHDAQARLEAAAFARLKALVDPLVVRVLAAGVHDHTPFVVTEALDGYFLADELRTHPLAAARILAIAARVCDAVALLHANDIAHGAVTASSVFVGSPSGPDDTDTSGVKLVAWGIAGAASKEAIAADVAACHALIERMLEPDAMPQLRELASAQVASAAKLAAHCRDVLAELPASERAVVGKRPPPVGPTTLPQNVPMPTNWSPPPPPREFTYGPRSSTVQPNPQSIPQAIVVPAPQSAAIVIGVVVVLVVIVLLLVWLV